MKTYSAIGITERGDAALDLDWQTWVEDGKPAILITKDASRLVKVLERMRGRKNVIVHCTITDYGGTALEPNVPRTEIALRGYEEAIRVFGPERVVLRVDPIITDAEADAYRCGVWGPAGRVIALAGGGGTMKTRIRISFLDLYPHVQERLRRANVTVRQSQFHSPLEERRALLKLFGQLAGREIEVCGEPGMECAGCVSAPDCEVFGISPVAGHSGQRKACACLGQKVELLSRKGQCPHGCLYCYWR